ncbi:MAG: hypothetical protein HKN98_13055, partial [Silicimonas sp.]|nr:hypothetical protein [Silicimonas sp.]
MWKRLISLSLTFDLAATAPPAFSNGFPCRRCTADTTRVQPTTSELPFNLLSTKYFLYIHNYECNFLALTLGSHVSEMFEATGPKPTLIKQINAAVQLFESDMPRIGTRRFRAVVN